MAKKASKKTSNKAKKKINKSKVATAPETKPVESSKATVDSVTKTSKKTTKPAAKKESASKAKTTSTTASTAATYNSPVQAEQNKRFYAFGWALAGIVIFALAAFWGVPAVYKQTSLGKIWLEEKDRVVFEDRQDNARENAADEDSTFSFGEGQEYASTFTIDIDGEGERELAATLKYDWAPDTVENFVRLADRDLYNETYFYRYVEEENFNVIQGTDIKLSSGDYGRGQNFATADGEVLLDEIWTDEGVGNFRAPEAYRDYDQESDQVTMPKGSIAMAKGQAENSATSQFFIVLEDTVLPAQYTTFGAIDESSFETLDFLRETLEPENNADIGITEPSKEVELKELNINL